MAPVATDAEGLRAGRSRRARTRPSPATNGEASVSFDEPGWHRIKATVDRPAGEETVIRSNRLDVCVPEPPASDCGALPADDQVRDPAAGRRSKSREPENGGGAAKRRRAAGIRRRPAPSPAADAGPGAPAAARASTAAASPRAWSRSSWQVLDAGVGDREVDDLLAGARAQGRSLREQGEGHERDLGAAAPAPAARPTACGSPSSTPSGAARAPSLGRVRVPG